MDESNFDRLMERYVTGQVTPQEQKKIEAWFDVRKNRHEEDIDLTEKEEQELFEKITANIDNEKEIKLIRPTGAVRRSRTLWTAGIAASLLIITTAVSLFLFDPFASRDGVAINTTKVILKDGSIVWLRGESKFTYSESDDGSRNGILEGEGLFEIAKDPDRPFNIKHLEFTITVVGTSFNLRAVKDSLRLNVLTGLVRITTPLDSKGVTVERFESVQLAKGAEINKEAFNESVANTLVAATEYSMNFTNESMKSVADRLSAKFNVEVRFSSERIGNCLVTADFTDRSLESTSAMIGDAINATLKRNGDVILIEGPGCD